MRAVMLPPVRSEPSAAALPSRVRRIEALEPLWVAGLVGCCLLLGWLVLAPWPRVTREQLEGGLYLALGTLLPLALVALALPLREPGVRYGWARRVRLVLAGLVFLACLPLVVVLGRWYVLPIAAIQVALQYRTTFARPRNLL